MWEKWYTPDCGHLDTVFTVNMDSHDEYFAYQRKVEEHNDKVTRWEENHMTVNSLLFLHYDPEMKAILKAHENWDPTDDNDYLALLFTIGDVMNDTIRELSDLATRGCDSEVAHASEVPPGEKVSTHDPEPVGTECDIQIPEYNWVPNDWETENEPKIPEANVSKENIVETTHVSLCKSQTIDCSFVLNKEELAVAVRDVTPAAFEKVDVEVREVNPANGSTNDVIAAV